MFTAYESFWKENPALLYGIAGCLGCAFAFGHFLQGFIGWSLLLFPLFFHPLFSTRQLLGRSCLAGILCLCFAFWASALYRTPEVAEAGVKGKGVLTIHSLFHAKSSFGSRWEYRGSLDSFAPEEQKTTPFSLKNLPVTVAIPDKESIKRPLANASYQVSGVLKKMKNGRYYFQVSNHSIWHPVHSSWSAAEMRYQVKKLINDLIVTKYKHLKSQSFLSGIATGTFNDRLMASDFGRFGLQHIMAISGFHFSIIGGFLSLLFCFLLPHRLAAALLGLLLTLYFLFLGPSASVIRSWAMCMIACGGIIAGKKSYGLNSLGVALLLVLAYDPLQIENIGFQFSFATTGAILLLFPPADHLLQKIFLKRSLEEALNMDPLDRHGYLLLTFLRKGLSLTLAVNLVALPLTLYHFHKFPLMSLLFNLFFPFLVSISMILLLLGFITYLLLPFIGSFIHDVNNLFTQVLINFTTYTPKNLDVYLSREDIPAWLITALLGCVFLSGIYYRNAADRAQREGNYWV